MVRMRHFEFVCRTMHIEPTVARFRVFHQMRCTQGFYSFVQRASAKKVLQHPPKSFHDWKHKFFFIKAGVIPLRMIFRGKEDVPTETLQTPVDENWYQDLKDVPNIALPEKALVGAGLSLNWKMDREYKPVYTEGDHVAFKREGGKMGTIQKKPDEELWFHRIVKNFVLPRDADLSVQPAAGAGDLSNLGIGLEKKRREVTSTSAPKKNEAEKAQSSKANNVGEEKKVKRKQTGSEAEGQPAKKIQRKKITRKGNLDAFISESAPTIPTSIPTESLPVVNEKLPPSPLPATIVVVQSRAMRFLKVVADDVDNPQVPEPATHKKEKTAEEIYAAASPSKASGSMPENMEKVSTEERGSFSDVEKNSPIRPDETLGGYYYRTYSKKDASDIHAPAWNLKKGDTFSDWHVCRDWLQGIFPPGEIKFQESRSYEQTYHAYLEETASHASTTHHIVREWYSMQKRVGSFQGVHGKNF
ncbi:hypothetical protein Hdeb2414_s0025g00660721 [Helianthus debilis subsp. tardiflorus]